MCCLSTGEASGNTSTSRKSPDSEPDVSEFTDLVMLHSLDIISLPSFEDILIWEEVAAPFLVPEARVYEKPRPRSRNPMPCLRVARVTFDWDAVIN